MADAPLHPYAMAALATAAVPALDVVAVSAVRVGADYFFSSVEDSVGRNWVVRVPNGPATGAAQEAEVALLRALANESSSGRLPFEVPRPRGFSAAKDDRQAMVYPQLPGLPLDMEEIQPGPGLAMSLGRTIAALHELSSDLVAGVGLPVYTTEQYRLRLRAEVEEASRTGNVTDRLTQRWRDAIRGDQIWGFEPCVIHGDMAPDHLLVQHGRICAMLDFSTVQVSDPAEDLAPLLAATSDDVAASIMDAYRANRPRLDDPNLEERARLLAEIAVIRWLLFGVRHRDSEIVADARAMIADLDQAVEEEERELARIRQAEQRRSAEAALRQAAVERASIRADRVAASLDTQITPDAALLPDQDEQPTAVVDLAEIAAQGNLDDESADPTTTEAHPGQPSTAGQTALEQPKPSGGPHRQSVTDGGIGIWGRPSREIPSWDDADVISGPQDIPRTPPPDPDDGDDDWGGGSVTPEAAGSPGDGDRANQVGGALNTDSTGHDPTDPDLD